MVLQDSGCRSGVTFLVQTFWTPQYVFSPTVSLVFWTSPPVAMLRPGDGDMASDGKNGVQVSLQEMDDICDTFLLFYLQNYFHQPYVRHLEKT